MSNPISFVFKCTYNDLGLDDNVLLEKECVYRSSENKQSQNSEDSKDSITITERSILISGFRSKKTSFENCFKGTDTVIYKELLRCMVFAYMTQKVDMQLGDCTITTDKKIYNENDFGLINHSKLKPLCDSLVLNKTICEDIFLKGDWSTSLLTSLMEFIVAYNSDTSDKEVLLFEYWKAFNTLYSFYYERTKEPNDDTKEYKELNAIKEFAKLHLSSSSKSLIDFADKHYSKSVMVFRLRAYLLNVKKRASKNKKKERVKEAIMEFNEPRLLSKFNEVVHYDINKKKSSLGIEIKDINGIDAQIKSSTESDIELLCFATIKYGYFLRCRHFHGERSTSDFLIFNSAESYEISIITEMLKLLIIDLYNLISMDIKQ